MTSSLLIERIAAVRPEAIALRDGTSSMSYGELNRRADGLARRMRRHGVTRGTAVAICLERSFAQIIAALATMRAGAAYVPLDPAWPEERIAAVLADSEASVLIASTERLSGLAGGVIGIDPDAMDEVLHADDAQIADDIKLADDVAGDSSSFAAEELAYIIYTSGSTGVPKGVEITHGNLNHLLAWHLEAFAVTASDRASHLAGLGFDAAVWEVWPYLTAGASIALTDASTRIDPSLLRQWIVDQDITIAFVPTPLAEPLLAAHWPGGTQLRTLLVGGDTLHTAPQPGLPFVCVNNYGPTECSVVATSGIVPPGLAAVPAIGAAIRGTSIYILDSERRPVAAGVRGEIYIGGPSVARGYRNLPEQTAQAFLHDPFGTVAGGRMYKTGDIGALLPDGQIAFFGRSDSQVKIRGNRIELDEIASVLNRQEEVMFSVVVGSKEDDATRHLIAYVLPHEGASPTMRGLQEFAARSLPPYMIPSVFVQLARLPLNANGKLDRDALPLPSPENSMHEEAPRTDCSEIEETLLTLVRGLLGTDQVNLDDDFFLVGGHSLLGTQLVLRARETFGVMLSIRDLFEAATVARLAARIESLILEEISGLSDEEAIRLTASESA